MKECTPCLKQYDDSWSVCLACNQALRSASANGESSLSVEVLTAGFSKSFSGVFLPNNQFYENWNPNTERLKEMAGEIFTWLKLTPIPVAFAKGMKNTPGIYVRQEQGASIFVNINHAKDPFQVAAILAHECMHHYMHINNLEIVDRKQNELKTDLATICVGLGVLVINGMSHKSHWYLTIILLLVGRIYINERRRSFGYYKPEDYCKQFGQFLTLRSIDASRVTGYIHPEARSFLPGNVSKKQATAKSETIERHKKRHKTYFAVQVGAVCVIVPIIIASYISVQKQRQGIVAEMNTKKQSIVLFQTKLEQGKKQLEKLKKDMDYSESVNDSEGYKKALFAFQDFKEQWDKDYRRYKVLVNTYNVKVDELKST